LLECLFPSATASGLVRASARNPLLVGLAWLAAAEVIASVVCLWPLRRSGPQAAAPWRAAGGCRVPSVTPVGGDDSRARAAHAEPLDVSLPLQGRPCGRPPAAAVLAPAATRRPRGDPASPSRRARTHATPDEVCSPLAVRRADPRPAWTHAGSDTCWPRAGHRNRARQSDDDADAKAGQARPGSCSTRWRASPALHRVSTGRIPASPGLSLGSVPTGLVLVVEIVLVGPRATSPPKPGPHRLDSVQNAGSPLTPTVLLDQTQQQEKHRIVISRGTAGHIGATSLPSVRDNTGYQRAANAPAQQLSSASIAGRSTTRLSLARRKPEVQIPSPPPTF
jgi:hypothetical protein